jgi:hypothetical protein
MYVIYLLREGINTVLRNKLWNSIRDKAVPEHLVEVIKSLYKNTKIIMYNGTRVRKDTDVINQGEKQGWPLSPSLFSVCRDEAINQSSNTTGGIKVNW